LVRWVMNNVWKHFGKYGDIPYTITTRKCARMNSLVVVELIRCGCRRKLWMLSSRPENISIANPCVGSRSSLRP
jgi:hypothetical protein